MRHRGKASGHPLGSPTSVLVFSIRAIRSSNSYWPSSSASQALGARVEIDFSKIRPKGGRQSKCNFVVGDIFYDPQNPHDRGKLFYVKASLPTKPGKKTVNKDSLPDYVWRYAEKHKTFPHQSTADQWFDELQFESYRALGQCIGREAAVEIGLAIDKALG